MAKERVRWWTTREVADALCLSLSQVRWAIKSGQLKVVVRSSRSRYVTTDEVRRYAMSLLMRDITLEGGR